MIKFDDYIKENKYEHNKNWPYIPDHPYRILIIGSPRSRKTNVLLQRNFTMSQVWKPLKKEHDIGNYAASIKFIKVILRNTFLTLFPLL